MPSVWEYGKSFGIALGASLLLTLLVRLGARQLKLVAKPRPDRWHKKPTALFGGVAIFAAFVLTFVYRSPRVAGGHLLLACSGGMFAVGLIDDVVHLKPYAKLVGQIVFCALITTFGLRLHWLPSVPLDQALTVFWLVGITNAINLLDNLDGLAGGVSAISALYLVYFCHGAGQPAAAMLASVFAGAITGFLVFNFNPASIFMGDCGSLFLGFFLGAVTLVNNTSPIGGVRRNVVAVLAIPVLLLIIPIVDTTLVTVSRRMAGRPVSQGGRDHTSHRLVALGMTERSAALTLWTLSGLSGAVAVLVRNSSWMVGALLVPTFFLGCLFLAVFVGKVHVYQPVADEGEGAGRALLPTLADFTYKRRVFEVLCDVALIVIAYWAAFVLRFDGERVMPFYQHFILSMPIVLVQLGAFLALGLYDGLWRYTSMSDLSRQLRAVTGAWIVSTLTIVFAFRLESFSRSVLILDGLLLALGVAGTRVSFRLLRTWLARLQTQPSIDKRILIVGAGDGGELLLRELMQNRGLGMRPIGFVDDDPQKHGRVIHGVRVLGSLDRLSELAGKERVDEVLVSTTKLADGRVAELAAACKMAGIGYRRMRIALE